MKIQQILVDENSQNLLDDCFDNIIIYDKCIVVKKNSKYGVFLKKNFLAILKCEWDCIEITQRGIKAYLNNKCRFFLFSGMCVTGENSWDKIIEYPHGIIVEKNGLKGFFDYSGNEFFPCEYKKIECYSKAIIAFNNRRKKVHYVE